MTDWEVMTEDLGTNVDKDKWVIKAWEGMAIRTLDHNYMKRQRMIEKMARHPSGYEHDGERSGRIGTGASTIKEGSKETSEQCCLSSGK